MKKILFALIGILFALNAWATAGSCTQTMEKFHNGSMIVVKLVCTGDSTNGSLPTQTISTAYMTELKGAYFLYNVVAYPTSGGTAPDAADVTVIQDTLDLLGGKGANLIHATNTLNTEPYSTNMTAYYFPPIVNTLTLAVANQSTNSANYTIKLIFSTPRTSPRSTSASPATG